MVAESLVERLRMMTKIGKQAFFGAISAIALLGVISQNAGAESVFVKYRGVVSLAPFKCTDVTRSSTVERVCYDNSNQYMIIDLSGTYYHYCDVPSTIVTALLAADSIGSYYAENIKGSRGSGPYDCRTRSVPEY